MKFCAVICEYNPFHNGHRYLFRKIREAGYGHILCIMSGNFTQRGETAIFGKYVRARHAVENGADAVLELPAAFAVSPAELFAQGAVHILCSLENVEALAFGCESGEKEDFFRVARTLLNETREFRAALKENMKDGTSYIRARNSALLSLYEGVDEGFLSSPNNILGVEYCRALLAERPALSVLPVRRIGGGYSDRTLRSDLSSATAIRAALQEGGKSARKAKKNVPKDVAKETPSSAELFYKRAAVCALISSPAEQIALVPDCSEGMENRLKSLAKSNPDYDVLLQKTVSKRYTLARVRRILAQNFLGVERKRVREYAASPLYCKVLAVKKEGAEEILASLRGEFPLLARKSDVLALRREALDCFSLDVRANDLYAALTGQDSNEYLTLFV